MTFALQEVVLYIQDHHKKYLHVDRHSHNITTLKEATVFQLEPTTVDRQFYLRVVPSLNCDDNRSMSLDIWDKDNPELALHASNQHDNQKFVISQLSMDIFGNDGDMLLANETPLHVQFVSRLRIMSFNIQECLNRSFGKLSWNDRAAVTSYNTYESGSDIMALIQRIKPHVACLQEYSNNSGCEDLNTTHTCGADMGWRDTLQNPIMVDGFEVELEGTREDMADHRCFSYVGLDVPVVGHVLVVNIHVSYRQEYQRDNLMHLMHFIKRQLQSGTHIILAGDFNFTSSSPLHQLISDRLIPLTNQKIDHIFASTGLVDAVKVKSCHTHSSDHDPVMVEMRWADTRRRFSKSHHSFKVW